MAPLPPCFNGWFRCYFLVLYPLPKALGLCTSLLGTAAVGYSGCRVKLPRRRYLINPALPGLAIGTCFRLDRGILFA